MYRLALRITLNSQEAEDIVQDVIIKLWRMLEQGALAPLGEDSRGPYAMRMVRNLALDRQRLKVNQMENIDGMDFSNGISIERTLEQQERINLIRKAMNSLPEKQRTVMQLRDFEGYSYKEIADIMEISEEQVKVNLFRARQCIRQCIIHNA